MPRPGETVTDAEFTRSPGGKGANQAVAAARLGADVELVGCVGSDDFAREALATLGEAGVDLHSIRQRDGATGVALILVDAAGENQIVVAPGANARLAEADVPAALGAALCQVEIPPRVVAKAAERAEWFCLNAAPARELPGAVVERADLVVVNRYELDSLSAMPRLAAVTLGAAGAVLMEDGEEIARARPPSIDAVDGTAAGDAFTACMAVSLLEGRDREDALRRACAAGALAASRLGAQPSLPTAAEVDAIRTPG